MKADLAQTESAENSAVAAARRWFASHVRLPERREPLALEGLLIVGAVFFAPFNFLRTDLFYFTLSDAFATLVLALMLFNRTLPIRFFGFVTPLWALGLTLMTGGLIVSSVVNGDVNRGLIVFVEYIFAYTVIPIVLGTRSWRELIPLVNVFVWSIICTCLFGIYLIHVVGETNTNFVSGSGRMMSFVERDNECAAVIGLTVPLVLWLREIGRYGIPRMVATLAILLYGLMLTGSNTGLLVTASGITIYHLVTFSWRKALAGLCLAVLLALAGGGATEYLPPVFQKRVLGAIESGDLNQAGTFEGRERLIAEAAGLAENTTLLGFGADQYREISIYQAPVHNTYLLVLTEGGMFAALGLLLVLSAGFVAAGAVMRLPGGAPHAACTLAVSVVFAGILVAVPHVFGRFWVVPLALAIAVSLAFLRQGAPARSQGLSLGFVLPRWLKRESRRSRRQRSFFRPIRLGR